MKLGTYRHYEGGFYIVFAIAINKNTGEEMVVYKFNGSASQVYTQSITSFQEKIVYKEGVEVKRFEYVGCCVD